MPCPCGTTKPYEKCCGQYIDTLLPAPTPETLMRSRYTAYTKANIAYIKATMQEKPLIGFNEQEAEQWAKKISWVGLTVLDTYPQRVNENTGFVEFIAFYLTNGCLKTIHECSQFKKIANQWFYTDSIKSEHKVPKIAQNSPCPCGSLKKYKNCHGR